MVVVGAGLAGLSGGVRAGAAGLGAWRCWKRGDASAARADGSRAASVGQHAEGGGEYVDSEAHRDAGASCDRFGLGLEPSTRGAGYGDARTIVVRRRASRRSYGSVADRDGAVRPDESRLRERSTSWLRDFDPSDPASAGRRRSMLGRHHGRRRASMSSASPATARFLLDSAIRDDYGVESRDRLSQLFVVCSHTPRPTTSLTAGIEIDQDRGRQRPGCRDRTRATSSATAVRLRSARVTAVEHSESAVLRCAWSTVGQIVAGDFCVIAAPLPALRRIAVLSPALPGPLAEAIAELPSTRRSRRRCCSYAEPLLAPTRG